ncbi:MAG: tetratricopeptide repeat protein [Proteobacteria bacterium]|nr:tetratricopeptide repeat protein [Pseudomonadota bacterium]
MQRLGRYELGRPLGEGGAGTVYEAILHGPGGLQKHVALKVLHHQGKTLTREARLGGLLRHRGLVDVYEVGEVEGQWFCAMELCGGGTLAGRGPLPPRAVVEVGLAVCEALSHATEVLGLVHLDIKPSNLLLTAFGEVKVADLGIASARGFETRSRGSGSPAYMPPEQRRADTTVDARADLYALGVSLVELATGARPGAEQTLAWDLPMLTDAPQTPGVPKWLDPAVSRCLMPEPEDRWPTLQAFAEALRALDAPGDSLAVALGMADREEDRPEADDEADVFVGRLAELAALSHALAVPGVVAIVGPAGIGKSRLARQASDSWQERVWVDVANLENRAEVLAAVAAGLGQTGRTHSPEALGHALAARGDALVVFDNAERLHAHADLLRGWRSQAPRLRMLVTSRRRAELSGALMFSLEPMPVDDAVSLLQERARERGVTLPGDASLHVLAERLDGLPLALELAAGRLGVLSVEDVSQRLGEGILRSAEDGRHSTLSSAIQWSWDLLSPTEQSVLGQLGVFRGGFTAEAVEAVVEVDTDVLEVLDALVNHSLVRSGTRFGLLNGVAEFVRGQGEWPQLRTRHATYFATLGDERELSLHAKPGGRARFRMLRNERQNLLSAARHTLDATEDAGPLALPLVRACVQLLRAEGPMSVGAELSEALLRARRSVASLVIAGEMARHVGNLEQARAYLEQALAIAPDGHPAVVAALEELGAVRWFMGDLPAARELFESGLRLAVTGGMLSSEARFRGMTGVIHHNLGSFDLALEQEERSLAMFAQLGDRRSEAVALGNLGTLYDSLGRWQDARACYERAIPILERFGQNRQAAVYTSNLGNLWRDVNELGEARVCYQRALELQQALGDIRSMSRTVACLATVTADPAQARKGLLHAVDLAVRFGDRFQEGWWLAELFARFGGIDEEAWALRAEELLAATGGKPSFYRIHGVRAVRLCCRGERIEAQRALAECEDNAIASDTDAQRFLGLVRRRFASEASTRD